MNKLIITILFSTFFLTACQNSSNALNLPGESSYRVKIEIQTISSVSYSNAYVYDSNNVFVNDAIIKIDDSQLAKQNYDGYYHGNIAKWEKGSLHTYYVETPDGRNTTGTVEMPSEILQDISYSPVGEISSIYTIYPPINGWPEFSYIYCLANKNGTTWLYDRIPIGNISFDLNIGDISNASNVGIYSLIRNYEKIDGYAVGSFIYVRSEEDKM